MLVIVVLRVVPALRAAHTVFALTSLLSGLVTVYLMDHQRLKLEDATGLVSARTTGWFWLGLGSSVGIVVLAIFRNLRGADPRPD